MLILRVFKLGSILAIDYGLKRIGLAISDKSRAFAFPCDVIENKSKTYVLSELKKIINDRDVDLIVVGMPFNMDKTKGEMAENVDNFIAFLKQNLDVEIKSIDERLTSFAAEENLKESHLSTKDIKKHVDMEAARLILEEYIRD